MPLSKSISSPVSMASFAYFNAILEFASASFIEPTASSIRCSSGTTLFTIPILSASAALIFLPVNISSLALPLPISLGSLCVPPPLGIIPNPTSGAAITAFSDAILQSQQSESSKPPPSAKPFIAHIVGLSISDTLLKA